MGCTNTKTEEKSKAAELQVPNEYGGKVYTELLHNDFKQGNAAHAVRLIQDCTRQQKEDVCSRYKSAYETDIQEQCEASFSPVHSALFLYTLQDQTKSRAHYVMRCLQEPGNRDLEVIEIVTSLSQDELAALKQEYKARFKIDLEMAIRENLGDEISDILLNLIKEKEPSPLPPDEWAKKLVDAIAFNNLFEGKKVFTEAVMDCTYSQLRDALELFLKKCQRDINVEIEKYYQDNEHVRQRLTAISSLVRNKPLYTAENIHNLLEGFTNKSESQQIYLIFLSLTSNEDHLTVVKQSYRSAFFEALAADIRAEVKDVTIQHALIKVVR